MVYTKTLRTWITALLVLCSAIATIVLVNPAALAEKPAVATATAIQTVVRGKTTRFLVDLTTETGFVASVLPDPYRVMIDLENVKFDLPPGIGRKGAGLVSQIRYGIMEEGKSRIVIDTKGPVLIKQSQLLPKKGKSRPRIVIDLIGTTAEKFAEVQTRDETLASPETTASLPIIMPKLVADAPASKPDGRKVIVIDPGHGGMDPGAISPRKVKEKDVVWDFALELQKTLAASPEYDVRLTRNEDRFMTLNDRVAFTRRAGADLFIAIHADTVRGQTARGTTLYTLSDKASDEEAEALAHKENRVDVIAGVNLDAQVGEVADILIELVQRESKNHANLFSRKALEELKGVTTMTGKPLRSAGFVVLKTPDVPSVLIELGYLSSREDEEKMTSPAWREKMASALGHAINNHFKSMGAVE